MTKQHDKALLPCPFCGKEPMFASVTDVIDNFDHGFTIWCGECGIDMHDEYRDDVLNRWNTRSPIEAGDGGNGGGGWLDIASAPKDGTYILVAAYYDNKPTVGCAYWPEANEWFWWHDQEYSLSENGFEARFWQPLPSPPSPSNEGEKP
ncbi:Lar family restriction alleviation protein [Rhizobium sp. No.120]